MNLQANVQERSHLEGGQESKLVDAQTKLQPKPNKLQRTLQTLLLSCQNANQKKNRERDKEDEEK